MAALVALGCEQATAPAPVVTNDGNAAPAAQVVQRLSAASGAREPAAPSPGASPVGTLSSNVSSNLPSAAGPVRASETITPRHLEAELNRLEAELAN